MVGKKRLESFMPKMVRKHESFSGVSERVTLTILFLIAYNRFILTKFSVFGSIKNPFRGSHIGSVHIPAVV